MPVQRFVARTPGPSRGLTLTWAATQPVREELKISARLLDATGNVIAQEDRAPVHFTYPVTAWVSGEPVVDVYDLRLAGQIDGISTPLLILYRAADGGEIGRITLTPISINTGKQKE